MEPSSRQQQKRPLLRDGSVNDAAPPRLFATRWWILLSFCALSFLQALCWNFYSPISFAAKELYGWSDNNIAWVANAANIAMLTSIPPSQYAAEAFGSRLPTVVCALMMLVCTGLRCLPSLLVAWGPTTIAQGSFLWRHFLAALIALVVCFVLFAIVYAYDYHCGGCVKGPAGAPLFGDLGQ